MKTRLVIEISETEKDTVYAYLQPQNVEKLELKLNNSLGRSYTFFEDAVNAAIEAFPTSEFRYSDVVFVLPNYVVRQDIVKLPLRTNRFAIRQNIVGELNTLHTNFDSLAFGLNGAVSTARSLLYYAFSVPNEIQNHITLPCNKLGLRCSGLTFHSHVYHQCIMQFVRNKNEDMILAWVDGGSIFIQYQIQGQLMGFYNCSIRYSSEELEQTASTEENVVQIAESLVNAIATDSPTVLNHDTLSFEENRSLLESSDAMLLSAIEDEFAKYPSVESHMTARARCYYAEGKLVAKLTILNDTVRLHLNLPFEDYDQKTYHYLDMSDNSSYHDVPMMLKVRSLRALKRAKVLIYEALGKLGLFAPRNLFVKEDITLEPDDLELEEAMPQRELSEVARLNTKKIVDAIDLCIEYARAGFSTKIDRIVLALDKEAFKLEGIREAVEGLLIPFNIIQADEIPKTAIKNAW